jgi:PilZ domain
LRQVGTDGRPIDSRGGARNSEFRVAALLWAENRPDALSCTVHDFSDTGARLQLENARSARKTVVHIPNRVRLQFLPLEQEVDCRIVWRDGSHFGVEYLGCMRSAKRG